MRNTPTLLTIPLLGLAVACARPATSVPRAVAPERVVERLCAGCGIRLMSPDVADAIDERIADLKARGGACMAYGQVLEGSLASGRISVRPFMWRVGSNLASAQAMPSGEIALAREIDPLNVGVRTLDEVLWSAEHEAVHLTFNIPSGEPADEDVVDRVVRSCRPSSGPRAQR